MAHFPSGQGQSPGHGWEGFCLKYSTNKSLEIRVGRISLTNKPLGILIGRIPLIYITQDYTNISTTASLALRTTDINILIIYF